MYPQRTLHFGTWTKTVGWIIGINVAVFLLEVFLGKPRGAEFIYMFGLVPHRVFPYHLYTLITYAFLHAGLAHIFINMMVLFFFAGDLQIFMGTKRFLILYFGSVLTGGLAGMFMPGNVVIMGASGAIFGILVAFALYFPRMTVLLFFVIPMKMRTLAIALIVIELYFVATSSGGHIAHLAHLGGALFGLIYVKRVWRYKSLVSEIKYRWRRRRFRKIK
ncbi:MAG: rhomboid family intramembrane serine protease [Acidobacteriota bacterium]